jgi:hypothetical protein
MIDVGNDGDVSDVFATYFGHWGRALIAREASARNPSG